MGADDGMRMGMMANATCLGSIIAGKVKIQASRERERERQRHTDRERETDRQTDRQTEI